MIIGPLHLLSYQPAKMLLVWIKVSVTGENFSRKVKDFSRCVDLCKSVSGEQTPAAVFPHRNMASFLRKGFHDEGFTGITNETWKTSLCGPVVLFWGVLVLCPTMICLIEENRVNAIHFLDQKHVMMEVLKQQTRVVC